MIDATNSIDFRQAHLRGCDHFLSNSARLVTSDFKVVDVEVYKLCENDDDELVKFGVVASATDICVSPGPDGTLDEAMSLSWVHQDDEVIKINGVNHVVAGPDFECSSTPLSNDVQCPTIPNNISSAFQEVKDFYLTNANIELNFLPIQTKVYNYETRKDNNILEGEKDDNMMNEIFDFLKLLKEEIGIADNDELPIPRLYFVDEVMGDAYGIAPIGENLAFTENDFFQGLNTVIAHELGHAAFNCIHPEDHGVSNDMSSFMFRRIFPGDDLSAKIMNAQYLLDILTTLK